MMYEYRKKGKHLTWDERLLIERLNRLGYTQTAIAKEIGVSQQTISRELQRGNVKLLNGDTWIFYKSYSPDIAQQKADYEKTAHGPDLKIGKNQAYLKALEIRILDNYSPYSAIEDVSRTKQFDLKISKSTCYRYIRMGLFEHLTMKHLPNGNKPRKKEKVMRRRSQYPDHRSIEIRLPSIKTRNSFGHWEIDSIIGKSEGEKESILTLFERRTRAAIVIKPQGKTAAGTVQALTALRRQWGKHDYQQIMQTIASDNGSEFSDQAGIDHTGTTIFYCHPSCPHERGSNENGNRLIRRKLPKGQSLARKAQRDATAVQHWLNHYPREMLGGQTAADRLKEELQKLDLKHPERIYKFFGIE